MREVDAIVADGLTQEQVDKLRLLDNKLNESEWDIDLLLEDVPSFEWDGFDIDWELPELDDDEPEVIEDEAPEPPEEPKTKMGDLYQLGRHRLLCGDATKVEDLERLLGGG
jgi:site-specific DNA-methyltransferase (adenine-specific)